MKRIFAYFATFFLISTCASLPSLKENEQRYNAKMSDTSVQNLFVSLVDNQEDTVLNNYSTVYFSNLTSNFPINSHGTCAYVAISTILSFYDSYWDDDFVLEDLEQAVSYASTVSTNQNLDLSPIDNESPGVISEDIEDVENLTMIQYQNFILANQNNYLQSYLIKLADDMFGGYRFDNLSNPLDSTTKLEDSFNETIDDFPDSYSRMSDNAVLFYLIERHFFQIQNMFYKITCQYERNKMNVRLSK